jgi:uncharacterized protein VirK/YbjX
MPPGGRKNTLLKLFCSLMRTAKPVHPHRSVHDALSRVKYVARGLARPKLTAEWFALLGRPALTPLIECHPHALSKLQRPYLHRRLNAAARLAVLKRHYQFVTCYLDDSVRNELFAARGCLLAELPAVEPGNFAVRLFYTRHFSKEGDLSLSLVDEDLKNPLVTLTFCISDYGADGPREMFIGGLQCHGGSDLRQRLVDLTRSFHGLRPKALLVVAAQRLAQTWGILRIRAVSREEHIYRHYLKRRKIEADYDEFWMQCHGRLNPDGNFSLPAVPLARNLDELPSNKRAMYRRRYAMLAEVGEQIAARALGWNREDLPTPLLAEEFEELAGRLPQSDESWMPAVELEDAAW